jgi:hypothetical protein
MKPSEPDQPIKVQVALEDLVDTDRATDLYFRILRAVRSATRRKEGERNGDAAKPQAEREHR